MGHAARLNPYSPQGKSAEQAAAATLRRFLVLFPDRTTYEQWIAARGFSAEVVAAYERYLPARLQQQGTV